ncbi:DUF4197 domain-containing protein [Mucilaginibacter achroorhodeus]|uniref:DUF4197 domain-containing protein n=1 Tax=Mucilaginibacter achroorhodeus TaxID=2599294 RepID=A0A563TX97_9SPHI|nr:DUF4197 domain-containing protein [Mucilaginibacter achroorhodeus]TWR23987.1 DUF4197 domain-containing protein [Mucilaginibacter achroorhodeus]
MKKILLLIPFLFAGLSSCDTLNQVAQTTIQQYGNPSQLEMSNGLKQALEIGTAQSADQLSAVDGFFKNAAVKILFPPEAQKVESTLRSIGLGKLADNVILSLNRAAEDAASQAKPIFVNAIKQMTIQDVTNILLGQQDAATQYFRRTTTAQLAANFRPVIQTSLNKVGATKYYGDAAAAYNRIPLVTKINPNITDYVTQKAIDGLFVVIAREELNIRQNISARTTPLLQKVFGYYDRNKR